MANLEYTLKPTWEALSDVLSSLWVPWERTMEWLAQQGSGGPEIERLITCPLFL
jgi:hypothetical protein